MTKFDAGQRNDVLDSTRVQPVGSGAVLDLGGFGFNLADPGPGRPGRFPGCPITIRGRSS